HPRPQHDLDLLRAWNVFAFRDERGNHSPPVRFAPQETRRLLAQVLVAPLPQSGEGDVELSAFGLEPVLVAFGALAVADALEDPLVDQQVEAVGENVPGDTEAGLELVEAAESEEGVANDQERPALTDDLERAGNRAVLAVVVAFQHVPHTSNVVASRNYLAA